MSEIFHSLDGQVVKIVHDDGSETAVKTVPSVDGRIDTEHAAVTTTERDRGKYSLFISGSVGCFMSCGFCHLTLKGATYGRLTPDQVLANLKEAVIEAARIDPSIPQRYAKICWMGMGEEGIARPADMREITLALADWVLGEGYATGIDGVDLSTVLPRVRTGWAEQFAMLDRELDLYPANPQTAGRDEGRSRFRLFYSLHSAVQTTRDRLVPGALPLTDALDQLQAYSDGNTQNVLLHHLFLDNVNDTPEELDALITLITSRGLTQHELRLLRYNGCGLSEFAESAAFAAVASHLAPIMPVKVQVSLGAEQRAACGQFIVRAFDPVARENRNVTALLDIARNSATQNATRARP